MRSIQSLIKLSPALLVVLFLAGPAPAMADTPCCKITDIDTKKGIVSARETTTSRQFKFSLTNPVLVRRIKIGQGVQADFAAGKVTVVGIDGRYPIIHTAPAAAGTKTAPAVAAQGSLPAKNTRPTSAANKICCTITAVDSRSGVVSARDNATGRNFKFVANNKKTSLKGLKPGQGVYAHFASKQVSLDGGSACCRITELSPASTDLGQGGSDRGSTSTSSGSFDQGSTPSVGPSGSFEQSSTSSGGFDQSAPPSGGFDQGSAPSGGQSGGFDQGSPSSGGFDPGATTSGGFDPGGFDQGSAPSGGQSGSFDQGSPSSGGFDPGATTSGGFDPGGFDQGSAPSGGFDQGSVQQGGYGSGGGQLQGDRPWYEKEQSPAPPGPGGGQWQGDGSGMGTGANSSPTWTPPPPQ